MRARTVLAVKVRFAAPNNGAPLTALCRSQNCFLTREKRLIQIAAGNSGANGAKMAPFFTATDINGRNLADGVKVFGAERPGAAFSYSDLPGKESFP